ncbi:SseB family protein [Mycolicibacterium komossense]|nr:SseB family protein [Mycolicibacterium komossense]
MPGPDRDDYLVARLERPIKYHYPDAFDTARAQHDFLATDEDGPFVWIYVIVACARLVGTRFHAQMRSLPINIAFVIDNTLGNDERLDFAKVEFAAVGFADAVPEPTPSNLTEGETRQSDQAHTLVDNTIVRQAVAAFAAEPGQRRALEVLRTCMFGDLLFDITGSELSATGQFEAGARMQIGGGTGPGGGRALFAYTRNDEIARMYPPGTRIRSMVTPAVGALELVRRQHDSWLYIDPAGPTCAISAAEVDFALRNPRNEPLKAALAALAAGDIDRKAVLAAFLEDGPLLLGLDDATPDNVSVGSTTLPDGSTGLLGFTSAPEVVAFRPSDAVTAFTTRAVVEMIRNEGHGGIVINPSGPTIALSAAEIGATGPKSPRFTPGS